MSRGVGAASQADSVLLAADEHRDHVDLQIISGNETFIAFGETAVKAEGLSLVVATNPRFTVTGNRARMAIHMVCATGETSVVGYDKP